MALWQQRLVESTRRSGKNVTLNLMLGFACLNTNRRWEDDDSERDIVVSSGQGVICWITEN